MESGQIFKGMLLVSDIDGTLTELTEIPQNNIEAINRFIALGGTFTLCTGRPKCALAEILPQLKHSPHHHHQRRVRLFAAGRHRAVRRGAAGERAGLCFCAARAL